MYISSTFLSPQLYNILVTPRTGSPRVTGNVTVGAAGEINTGAYVTEGDIVRVLRITPGSGDNVTGSLFVSTKPNEGVRTSRGFGVLGMVVIGLIIAVM